MLPVYLYKSKTIFEGLHKYQLLPNIQGKNGSLNFSAFTEVENEEGTHCR